mgnify:CR=1 FL=1
MEKDRSKRPVSTNSSLDKAFAILEFLAQRNSGQSVPNISRMLKFNKSTTYNILKTLEYHSYVVKHSDGSYGLTSKLLELGSKFSLSNPASRVFDLCSAPVRSRFPSCNVSLATFGSFYNGTYLSVLDENSMYFSVGSTFPLYATASGKVLLAYSSSSYRSNFWENATLTKFTDSVITKKAALEEQLEEIRKVGYYFLEGELYANLYCVAVPVFLENQKIIASASICGPKVFIKTNFEDIKDETIGLGLRISEALGYTRQR